jgi:Metallo-peptidase family M12B Reprolysin-like/FG-GAP-like repeat
MKSRFEFLLLAISIFILTANILAANKISNDGIWQEIADAGLKRRSNERLIIPNVYKTFRADTKELRKVLTDAPKESFGMPQPEEVILSFPMPDGTFSRFKIQNSSIMEPELAAKYSEITSYIGQGIDDKSATARFDLSPVGFRAMILSNNGTILIEPYAKGDTTNYLTFDKKNVDRKDSFECEVGGNPLLNEPRSGFFDFSDETDVVNGTTLRTYRLAMAATGEYTTFFRQVGDTDAQAVARALAAINTTMNRVNAVYERDLAVRMILVANTDLLIYPNPATDPYANTSADLAANQSNIDTVIGSLNYDIGHLVGTGGGGVANLNVPCSGSKARGLTGRGSPVGDPFDIDYVAHEMGHQFGGLHTFNGSVGSCAGGNRSGSAAYETGSGITIMAYAGICQTQDLARNSIDTFHVKSLEQIVTFINGSGNCSVNTANGNTPPAIPTVPGSPFNVPKQTPFALTASTTDVNNDAITYDWQEYNLGALTTAVPNTDADGARPVFRPYLPTSGGIRYFPSLQYILENANVPPSTYNCNRATPCLTGELMPAITRTMNFQVVARDNRSGGGGINTATATVLVDAGSGPFVVTAPNTNVTSPSNVPLNVTWNVANTTAAPVLAANVRILLSTDGGQTFPVVLGGGLNDGSETVSLPAVNTTIARIKVEAVGNVFFDISDTNFTITSSQNLGRRAPIDFDGDNKTDISVFRPSVGEWYYQRSSNSVVNGATFGNSTDKPVPADYTGDGKTDIAVYRPSSGQWFVLRSEDFSFYAFPFGISTDIPTPGDFDGDGKADAAVFRPSTGIWYVAKSSGGVTIQPFGTNGDRPVVGDYDGDGKSDIAIFRPSVGEWYALKSGGGVIGAAFGAVTDKTVQGDYTGDGKADFAFYRPSTGFWFVLRSEDFSFYASPFGAASDTPTPGDYDGDGKFDQAVFRPSTGIWYINKSNGSGVTIQPFGASTDIPVPSYYLP